MYSGLSYNRIDSRATSAGILRISFLMWLTMLRDKLKSKDNCSDVACSLSINLSNAPPTFAESFMGMAFTFLMNCYRAVCADGSLNHLNSDFDFLAFKFF